jgi:hypothetical protein
MNTSPFPTETTDGASVAAVDGDGVEGTDDAVPAEPTYTADGLPSGLSLDTEGVISGTVTSLGTHTVTITTATSSVVRSVTFDWIVM